MMFCRGVIAPVLPQGAIGVTGTSGPGVALKSEAIGLAIMAELPLVIVNVQRGGPSTGLPTKTEQSDLFQAVWGRNGDAPLVVTSARASRHFSVPSSMNPSFPITIAPRSECSPVRTSPERSWPASRPQP